jgi:hypothetical protein
MRSGRKSIATANAVVESVSTRTSYSAKACFSRFAVTLVVNNEDSLFHAGENIRDSEKARQEPRWAPMAHAERKLRQALQRLPFRGSITECAAKTPLSARIGALYKTFMPPSGFRFALALLCCLPFRSLEAQALATPPISPAGAPRSWTTMATSAYPAASFGATFVSLQDTMVVLRLPDGKLYHFPLLRLSLADQVYIKNSLPPAPQTPSAPPAPGAPPSPNGANVAARTAFHPARKTRVACESGGG